MTSYQVWLGRFQPFHLGHLAFLERIVHTSEEPVVVGVLSMARIPGQTSGPGDSRSGHTDNPFTAFERRAMIAQVLEAEGLTNRVDVITLPRSDIYWEIARDMLPRERTIVLANGRSGSDAEFELKKVSRYRERGEVVRILDAPVTDISGSAVRSRLANGESVAELVHHSTLKALVGHLTRNVSNTGSELR